LFFLKVANDVVDAYSSRRNTFIQQQQQQDCSISEENNEILTSKASTPKINPDKKLLNLNRLYATNPMKSSTSTAEISK
jgi:hypothetical protein